MYIEETPIFLVGTKTDMRDANLADSVDVLCSPISRADGEALAKEIGAKAFIETSAKTGSNLQELFQQAIELALATKYAEPTPIAVEAPKEEKPKSKSSSSKRSSSRKGSKVKVEDKPTPTPEKTEKTEKDDKEDPKKPEKEKKKKWWNR